jgi:hypothetical protein
MILTIRKPSAPAELTVAQRRCHRTGRWLTYRLTAIPPRSARPRPRSRSRSRSIKGVTVVPDDSTNRSMNSVVHGMTLLDTRAAVVPADDPKLSPAAAPSKIRKRTLVVADQPARSPRIASEAPARAFALVPAVLTAEDIHLRPRTHIELDDASSPAPSTDSLQPPRLSKGQRLSGMGVRCLRLEPPW